MPPLKGFMWAGIALVLLAITLIAGTLVISHHIEVSHPYFAETLNWALTIGIMFVIWRLDDGGAGEG